MRRRRRSLAALLLAVVVVAALAPASVAAARRPPGSGAATAPMAAAARPFRLDLADANDFVAQANFVQCVGASMQMMLNIMGANDRTARTQTSLQTIARDLSGPTRAGFSRKGASVRGWSAGLNQLAAGPYRLVGSDTLADALKIAARSIRQTGKPVGLLVWGGRHAWVMSGFQATADPRVTAAFTVTRAIVLDPLYPYGSARWGRSPKPREAITAATLGKQFVPRRGGTWAGAPTGVAGQSLATFSGKYVIVVAYTPVVLVRNRHIAA
jgi:hypothetical protein